MLSITVIGKWTTPAAEMAESILNAVGEFSINEKPTHLRLVRITIFQLSMVDDFAQAVAKKIAEKNARGFLGKIKGASQSISVLFLLYVYRCFLITHILFFLVMPQQAMCSTACSGRVMFSPCSGLCPGRYLSRLSQPKLASSFPGNMDSPAG